MYEILPCIYIMYTGYYSLVSNCHLSTVTILQVNNYMVRTYRIVIVITSIVTKI